MIDLPKLPLGAWFEAMILFLVDNLSRVTRAISFGIEWGVNTLSDILVAPPAVITIVLFGGLVYWRKRKIGLSVFTVLGMGLAWNLNLWQPTMQTLSLVILSTMVAIAIGIPLGVLAALSNLFHRIIMPILDFMQTLPAFVYLIPAISFFGTGETAGVFATVIFATPPTIRLTDLGIRQVPKELVEAADSFGSTRWQKLLKVQLPVASPSLQAGVNQTIMPALSMVVIAALIGAAGVGKTVWGAVQNLQIGKAFESGICVVILAIILDRVMRTEQKHQSSAAK